VFPSTGFDVNTSTCSHLVYQKTSSIKLRVFLLFVLAGLKKNLIFKSEITGTLPNPCFRGFNASFYKITFIDRCEEYTSLRQQAAKYTGIHYARSRAQNRLGALGGRDTAIHNMGF